MPPASYRLDTVATQLIERLEAHRPTWLDDPPAARAGFSRITAEVLDRVIAEHDELYGDADQSAVLRRELTETFLPRYARLALAHNEREARGFDAWRKGDLFSRVISGGLALFFALIATELFRNPLALLTWVAALLVPFIPELRAGWQRNRYRGFLQDAVDDMGRIQDELDRYPQAAPKAAADPAREEAPEAERRPRPQRETIQ